MKPLSRGIRTEAGTGPHVAFFLWTGGIKRTTSRIIFMAGNYFSIKYFSLNSK
jgi:hypothetical protein